MTVTTVAGLGIISCAVILLLKEYKPEYAMITAVAASGVILLILLGKIFPIITEINTALSSAGVDARYTKTAFKAIGICYTTQFASDICKEYGSASIFALSGSRP